MYNLLSLAKYYTMTKYEQQMYKDISTIAKALTKLIKLIEKDAR